MPGLELLLDKAQILMYIKTMNCVDFNNIFVIIFLVGTGFNFLLNQMLEFIDWKWRCRQGAVVPAELSAYLTEEQLKKTVAYENAKYFLWIPKNIFSVMLEVVLVITGVYVWCFNLVWGWTENLYASAILFSIMVSIPGALLDIPFAIYREFRIEKRFGFSKMTITMWIADRLKELIVSLVITSALLCAAVALLSNFPRIWWLLLGIVYVLFSLLASYVYPVLIAPMFNKFTPLQDGELKDRLGALLSKTGFKAKSMYVMDASRRSGHSNAYFTGLGKNKRIVLYDTLIEQLAPGEIEAVLAHELGHYKHRHIVKKLCITIPLIFLVLFAACWLSKNPEISIGFGFLRDAGSGLAVRYQLINVFLLFMVVGGFEPILSLVSNAFSRRDEFQADRYSAGLCGGGKDLSVALIKLNRENLSEIVPPKIYSVFNYSHPPLLERIRAVCGSSGFCKEEEDGKNS